MGAHRKVGAAAPWSATPESDNARRQPGVEGVQAQLVSLDSAAKAIATVTARAARIGIELHPIADDAWLLRHARGADIGIVRGVSALVAAVAGFEAAMHDVRELVQRMRGAA